MSFTGAFTDNPGDAHTAQWMFDGVPIAGVYLVSLPTAHALFPSGPRPLRASTSIRSAPFTSLRRSVLVR